jgi:hypothetical protein
MKQVSVVTEPSFHIAVHTGRLARVRLLGLETMPDVFAEEDDGEVEED